MPRFLVSVVMALFASNGVAMAQNEFAITDANLLPRLKPVRIDPNDSDLARLQKERFNSAIEVVQGMMKRLHAGTVQIQFVIEAQERMASAGLDIETDPKVRIAILEEWLRLAKLTEILHQSELDAGKTNSWSVAYATYARANAKIRLLEEKEARRR